MYIPINVCTCWHVNLSCAIQASQIRIRFNLIMCFISMWQRNHTKNHNTFLSMHQFQTRNTCAVSTSLKTPEPKEQGQAKRAGKVRRWTFVTMFKQDINPRLLSNILSASARYSLLSWEILLDFSTSLFILHPLSCLPTAWCVRLCVLCVVFSLPLSIVFDSRRVVRWLTFSLMFTSPEDTNTRSKNNKTRSFPRLLSITLHGLLTSLWLSIWRSRSTIP